MAYLQQAGSCSADSFVVAESSVLRINISGKILPIANLQTVERHCAHCFAEPRKDSRATAVN